MFHGIKSDNPYAPVDILPLDTPDNDIIYQEDLPLKWGVVTNENSSECDFRLDYSNLQYSRCNRCAFCYSVGETRNYIARESYRVTQEWQHHPEKLITTPITIGRQGDPFLINKIAWHSFKFAKFILQRGGKIIFLSPNGWIPEQVFSLCKEFGREKIQYQFRLFTDDSPYGTILRKTYAHKWPTMEWQKLQAKKLMDIGIKVTIKIDPIILKLNSNLIDNIIKEYNEIGINSFIFKTIVATNIFKEKLSLISKRYSSMLSEQYGNSYWQYPSDVIFDELSPIIINNPDSVITFCNNAGINYILQSHNNCCQFDNADVKYNINYYRTGKAPRYIPINTFNNPLERKKKK